ncbi:SH3 domain-containing protein [Pseudanabaena sp. FACHB-2040]|uniref:SH3 domain-containing protein n=1 Tax=Pseudanabaena sp. FACHB-2040 TaxID=2692859 RepID=UPI0016883E3A|nr:SH3 domain-containing protein [Pseudanabaena sp. FACHB-2040]MBD2256071.1 SH3 domain-containing protein [Pseudanabaena sp. FACHB-2040]
MKLNLFKPYLLAGAIATLATLTAVSCASQSTPQTSTSAPPATSPTSAVSTPDPTISTPDPAVSTPDPTGGIDAAEPTAQAPTSSEVITCVVTMAVVDDPEPPLNVRSSPAVADGNRVDQLENGTYLTVTGEQSGWFKISEPVTGWVAQNRVDSSCNQKVERIRFSAGANPLGISDRFVGTGSHQYVIPATAGQTLTLQSQEGPLPFIADPDGQPLTETVGWETQTDWSGRLPLTGDYTLTLDSNYKGYDYTFSMQIQ